MDDVNVGIRGGWVDRNWKQLYIQFAYVVATCAYTFVMTAIVAKAIDSIPGLKLRTSPEGEILGMDETEVCHFSIISSSPILLILSIPPPRSESLQQTISNFVVMSPIVRHSDSPGAPHLASIDRRQSVSTKDTKSTNNIHPRINHTTRTRLRKVKVRTWKRSSKRLKMEHQPLNHALFFFLCSGFSLHLYYLRSSHFSSLVWCTSSSFNVITI